MESLPLREVMSGAVRKMDVEEHRLQTARESLSSVTTNVSRQKLRNLTPLQHAGRTLIGIATNGAAKLMDVAELSNLTQCAKECPFMDTLLVSTMRS